VEKDSLRREILSATSAACEFGSEYPAQQYVKDALLALEGGNHDDAVTALAKAQRASTGTPVEAAWLHIGNSRRAQFDGDHETAERELQAAHKALAPGLTVADVHYGANVAYAQFLRTAIVRQFLPQVYYPTIDPELARLLDSS
jgi:hypothetical protein